MLNCLKINLKRNKKGFLFFFSIFFSLSLLPLFGQESIFDIQTDGNSLKFSLYLANCSPKEVFERLDQGMRSEIYFSVYLYRKAKGLRKFFSDKLISEWEYSQEAQWDIFSKQYVITDYKGEVKKFSQKEEFISQFFSIKDVPLPLSIESADNYYAAGRTRLRTIKFLPPLNILGSFSTSHLITTEWEYADIPEQRGMVRE